MSSTSLELFILSLDYKMFAGKVIKFNLTHLYLLAITAMKKDKN